MIVLLEMLSLSPSASSIFFTVDVAKNMTSSVLIIHWVIISTTQVKLTAPFMTLQNSLAC